MLKVMLKSKYIRIFAVIILAISIASCFTAGLLVTAIEDIVANMPERPANNPGSGKYMTYTMGHPSGYTAKGNDSGWKIIADSGDVIYETEKKVELANRAGYIYEIDDNGIYSIVNLKSGKVEWTCAENEIITDDDAGFWVIKVKVDEEKFFSQNYYYLLDENYKIGADGVIFNELGNDSSLGHMENYIYGQREVNYTMDERSGIEDREKANESCAINSDGKTVYTTTEGEILYVVDGDKAWVTFNHSEKDDVYVSLAGPKRGQIVEVIKSE